MVSTVAVQKRNAVAERVAEPESKPLQVEVANRGNVRRTDNDMSQPELAGAKSGDRPAGPERIAHRVHAAKQLESIASRVVTLEERVDLANLAVARRPTTKVHASRRQG